MEGMLVAMTDNILVRGIMMGAWVVTIVSCIWNIHTTRRNSKQYKLLKELYGELQVVLLHSRMAQMSPMGRAMLIQAVSLYDDMEAKREAREREGINE